MFKLKPLASSVALSLLTGIAVAAAPGGAILQNKVTVTYNDIGGKAYTAESNIVEITIREVRTATLIITQGENQEVAAAPGSKVYSVHTLTNNGNVAETYALAAANVTGGGDTLDAADIKIYLDTDGNGVLNGTEGNTPITSTSLAAGASAKLIVASTLPATMTASDTIKVTLNAIDSQSTTASSTNTVNITFLDTNVTTPIHVWDQLSGGNCHAYTVITTQGLTWSQAKTSAESFIYKGKTGHLTTLTSAAENTFVNGKMSVGGWIGAKRANSSSPFTWVTSEPFSYTNWNTGKPSVTTEAGIVSYPNYSGKWEDSTTSWTPYYWVEFDTDCDLPSVAVELEGAKDITCDGTPDAAFGTARLAEMGSGECAIMRSRATNNGKSLAKGIVLNYTVPQYASYLAGTLTVDGAATTDAADADAGTYTTASKTVAAKVGDVAVGATSPDAQFSVKID